MSSIRSLLLLRIIPVFLVVGSSFILPWIAKTVLITGLNGVNFEQTDVSQCEVIHRDTLMGCEDLHVYNAPSGPMIFTGCVEKFSDRFTWFPGITARNTSREGFYQAPFYVYEPEKDKVSLLTVENFPADTDRVWHGFDILETSPGNILIYAINHRRTGSMIERFHHTIGSSSLVYEKSFDCNNDIIFTPNDVAVVGKDEFFVTNDHVAVDGLWRMAVDLLRLPMTHVAFHHPTTGFKIVAKGIRGVNGITAEKPGNKVFVSALAGGEVQVYERNEEGDLKLIQVIDLDFLPDNPSITSTGDLLITGVPVAKTALDFNPTLNVHSKVVRVPLAQLGDTFFGSGSGQTAKPIVEPVLMDVTGIINGATTSVEISYGGTDWLFITSWRAVGLTRCKLS